MIPWECQTPPVLWKNISFLLQKLFLTQVVRALASWRDCWFCWVETNNLEIGLIVLLQYSPVFSSSCPSVLTLMHLRLDVHIQDCSIFEIVRMGIWMLTNVLWTLLYEWFRPKGLLNHEFRRNSSRGGSLVMKPMISWMFSWVSRSLKFQIAT